MRPALASPAAALVVALLCTGSASALQKIYAANISGGTVAVVDVDRRLVIDRIAVGREPDGIAAAADGSVYVANYVDGTVSVIDGAADTVVATIAVDPGPVGLAVSPDGREVYVACKTARTLVVIDAQQRAAVASIPIGQEPNDVVVSPRGDRAYVARSGGSSITVIDTATRQQQALLATGRPSPNRLAVSPDGRLLYVSYASGGNIDALRLEAPVGVAFSGSGAGTAIALSPEGAWVYGAGNGTLTAATSDLEVQTNACGGTAPYDLLVLPDGRVVAADMRGDALRLFAAGLAGQLALVPVDGGPFALAATARTTPALELAIEAPPHGARLEADAAVPVRIFVRSGTQFVATWTLQLRSAGEPDRQIASGSGAVRAVVTTIDTAELAPGRDYQLVLRAVAADQSAFVRRLPLRVVPRTYALMPLEPTRGDPYAATAAMDATGGRFVRWPAANRLEVFEPQGAGRYDVTPPLAFTRVGEQPSISRDGRRITLRGDVGSSFRFLLFDLETGMTADLPSSATFFDLDGSGAHLATLGFRGTDDAPHGWNYDLFDVAAQSATPITNSGTVEDIPAVCRPAGAGRPRISLAGDRVAFFTALPLGGPPFCNLYTYDASSGMRRLVSPLGDEGPLLPPTMDDAGARLAYLRRPAHESVQYPLRPVLVDLASGASEEILDDPSFSALSAAISGDGESVIVASCADLDPAVGNPDYNQELFRFDRTSRQFTQITDTRGGPQDCYHRLGESMEPRVSRDASVVAFRGMGFGTYCGSEGIQRDEHSGLAFGDTRAVRIDPTNAPPRLSVGADVVIAIGDTVEIAATADDPDDDPIAWFAELDAAGALPDDADFYEPHDDETEAVFFWDVDASDVGTHALRLGAFDGRGGDDVASVAISVCRFVDGDPIAHVLSAIFHSQPAACGASDVNEDGIASAADLIVAR